MSKIVPNTSVADQIRSTPAQATETPPEVGSTKFDDSELTTTTGGETETRIFVTRYPTVLDTMDDAVKKKISSDLDEMFWAIHQTYGIFVGITVEVDPNTNEMVGVTRHYPTDGVEIVFNKGAVNPESVVRDWIIRLMMDPDVKSDVPALDAYSVDLLAVELVSATKQVIRAVEIKGVFPKHTLNGGSGAFAGKQRESKDLLALASDLINEQIQKNGM